MLQSGFAVKGRQEEIFGTYSLKLYRIIGEKVLKAPINYICKVFLDILRIFAYNTVCILNSEI